MYTDLATVHNSTEMNNLIALVSSTTARAWIGLETGDEWTWHWPDQKVDFLKWKAGEPQNNNQEACAAMNQDGEWFESDCRTEISFVCHGKSYGNIPISGSTLHLNAEHHFVLFCFKYKNSGFVGNSKTSGYTFVAQAKSWRNAQTHCRDLSSELVSIDSAEKNEAVHNVSASQRVWIGLFKDPWKWSDGSISSFRFWKPSQPNYLEGQNCVAAVFRDQGRWNDLHCNSKHNFICHGRKLVYSKLSCDRAEFVVIMLLTINSCVNSLFSPAARNYIPTTTSQTRTLDTTDLTTPSSTADEAIVTLNFTVVASTIPENDTVTSTERITISELATPNTTDPVSTMSSTEFSSATTEMSTAATMQLLPTATAEVATDAVSVFTPLMEILTKPDISPTLPSGVLKMLMCSLPLC